MADLCHKNGPLVSDYCRLFTLFRCSSLLIGTGDYYSSGNDLSNFTNINMDDIPQMAKDGRYLLL